MKTRMTNPQTERRYRETWSETLTVLRRRTRCRTMAPSAAKNMYFLTSFNIYLSRTWTISLHRIVVIIVFLLEANNLRIQNTCKKYTAFPPECFGRRPPSWFKTKWSQFCRLKMAADRRNMSEGILYIPYIYIYIYIYIHMYKLLAF